MFKFITSRPLWLNIIVGFLLAVGLFSLALLSLDWITDHGKSSTVPSVKGKKYAEAVKILKKQGFEVEVLDSIYSDTLKPLMVVKQVPDADEVVKTNRTIMLIISRAVPPTIEMPNLIGYSYRNAAMVLDNMGLKIGDTLFRPDFAKNSILEMQYNGSVITPGTKIKKGSTISLVLGDGVGDKQFAVPSIVGMQMFEALDVLKEKGIILGAVVADANLKDTANAWIYRQNPTRFDDERTMLFMRSGQTMDVWIQQDKASADSLSANLPGQEKRKKPVKKDEKKSTDNKPKTAIKKEADNTNGNN